jgi:hypothetical protein
MAKYSIVVPFHNEEENVTILYARLKQVMEQVDESFELILVDDGSTTAPTSSLRRLPPSTAAFGRQAAPQLRPDLGPGRRL